MHIRRSGQFVSEFGWDSLSEDDISHFTGRNSVIESKYRQGLQGFRRKEGVIMKNEKDTYRLLNGVEIPCIGFGTWQTPSRIADNLKVFDFELSEADVRLIADHKGCVGLSGDPDKMPF